MNKCILTVGIVFLSLLSIKAQKLSEEIEVDLGKPYQVVDAESKEYIAIGDGSVISVKIKDTKGFVQKFDATTMKEEGRSEYTNFPKYTNTQGLINLDGNFYIIYEAYNKKQKTFSVYSRKINIQNTKLEEQNLLVTSSRPVINSETATLDNLGQLFYQFVPKFDVLTSFDKTKLLIRYRLKPASRKDKENYDELGFYVFDKDLNKVQGAEVKMPYTEAEMNNLAFTVGGDGIAYMLARINSSKALELLKINSGEVEAIPLDVNEGLSFDRFDLKENAAGNIVAAAYYANGFEFKMNWTGTGSISTNVNGIYVFEFNDEGTVLTKKEYEFPVDFIKQSLSSKQKSAIEKREKDGKAGILDLRMKTFELNEDGSMIFVGEVCYTKKELYMMSTENVTHFGNIVITKLDESGALVWNKKLTKNQAVVANYIKGLNTLGFYFVKGEKDYYMLFVDNAKNAKLNLKVPAEPHKGGFGGFLMAYKVSDSDGEIEKHLLFDLGDIKGTKAYQFDIRRILNVSGQSFLMEIYIKNKKDNMVKMTFK